ncbi:MAG: hypothetical protein ACE5OS_11690 [Anaerolineae bacterium]
MRNKRKPTMYLALTMLVAGVLACNAPTPTTSVPQPPPAVTPYTPPTSPPQETSTSPPIETTPEATQTPLPPTPTTPPATPTQTPLPPTPTTPPATPTPTPSPLDFRKPEWLSGYQHLGEGNYECTIVLEITGGTPPYTVHHDLEVFTTSETNPAIVFQARGCSGIVHTIIVESADGQEVKKGYWIAPPWCQD